MLYVYTKNLIYARTPRVLRLFYLLFFLFFGLFSVGAFVAIFNPTVQNKSFAILMAIVFALFSAYQCKRRQQFLNVKNQAHDDQDYKTTKDNPSNHPNDLFLETKEIDSKTPYFDYQTNDSDIALKINKKQDVIYSTETEISFLYMDANDNISKRSLILKKRTPIHLEGICLDYNEERTFRVDSIMEYYGDSQQIIDNFPIDRRFKQRNTNNIIFFRYETLKGNIRDWKIHVTLNAETYFKGHEHDQDDITFRKNRIIKYYGNSMETLDNIPIKQIPKKTKPKKENKK